MATAARTPVIIGTAQVVNRPDLTDLPGRPGPIELMLDATRRAFDDAGTHSLVGRVGWIGVAGGLWAYKNAPHVLQEQLGAPASRHVQSSLSGSGPQELIGRAADAIARGEVDVAIVVGGEARWTARQLKRAGLDPTWLRTPGEFEPEIAADLGHGANADIANLGGATPWYALFEDRLRARANRSVDDHRDRMSARWARFSEIAATNPHAWDQTVYTAAEIREPTPNNRMIAFPYTKAMVANNQVDMATCTVIASEAVATEAKIDEAQLVYPLVTVGGHETFAIAHRRELDQTPALTCAGLRAFEHAGFGPDDIDHVDLYACFPSIVEISSRALGLDDGRDMTITGGLGFAASPLANWVGHSVSAMVERVRTGGRGLIHANGGLATKHSFAVYAQEPATAGFAYVDIQDDVDLDERTAMNPDPSGDVEVEATTVVWDREGPDFLFAAITTGGDDRGWARSSDPDLMHAAQTDGLAGRRARVADGIVTSIV